MSKNQDKQTSLISDEVKEYVSLRIQSLKLTAVENLSSFTSKSFGVFVFVLLLSIAVVLLTFGFTLWLGDLLESHALAFAIVGGVYLVASLVVFALRDRLIANSMVRMFSKMFFSNHKNAADDE
ncbi:MAG: hypothetical protein E7128_04010 [Rikenellaceae bacterium]|nr:hypothetical protein [Rikenellaceae bacterium]MBR2443331.1 phage holin family protein [Rikenellaceae bacterium]